MGCNEVWLSFKASIQSIDSPDTGAIIFYIVHFIKRIYQNRISFRVCALFNIFNCQSIRQRSWGRYSQPIIKHLYFDIGGHCIIPVDKSVHNGFTNCINWIRRIFNSLPIWAKRNVHFIVQMNVPNNIINLFGDRTFKFFLIFKG